ncbi:DUF4433 domain-containing protein [Bacteroidaceae bacterium HV4-6-C5C]|nr:DUF4433 domain-containing protein [Bacteroidaceae bacterium HV4-6-C5C]
MPINYSAMPIYRMVHINNVEYVLRNGICIRGHHLADPDYINIGDTELIAQRVDSPVRIVPPGGNLGDYVPFYFAGHTPMLYNIKTGWRGITQRPQSDIVFLVSSVGEIVQNCPYWCFTDGHAKHNISRFYNNIAYMINLDWVTIHQQYWNNTLEDMDRQRRKAAEFLVKDYVPNTCIRIIYVFNEACKQRIEALVNQLALNISVNIDINKNLYFP